MFDDPGFGATTSKYGVLASREVLNIASPYVQLTKAALLEIGDNTSWAQIVAIAGVHDRVLDVGCGPGNLAALLTHNGSKVVGVDNDPVSLEIARSHCEAVYLADLDRDDLAETIGKDAFDAIFFADVLEHVRDPLRVLISAKTLLRDGGSMYVSIPNIAHGAVRLSLLRGEFTYQRLGILDETHVHFYTRESVEDLLADAGLAIVEMRRTWAPIFEESDLVPFVRREEFPSVIVDEIEADPESTTLQFIVKAEPTPLSAASIARSKCAKLARELRTLEARYAQLERGAQNERASFEIEREAAAVLARELDTLQSAYEMQLVELKGVQLRADDAREAIESLEEQYALLERSAQADRLSLESQLRELLATIACEREAGAALTKELDDAKYAYEAQRAEHDIAHQRAEALRVAIENIEQHIPELQDRNAALERIIAERDGQIVCMALECERVRKDLDVVTNLHIRVNGQFVEMLKFNNAQTQRRSHEREHRPAGLEVLNRLAFELQSRVRRRAFQVALRIVRKARRVLPL